MRKTWASPFVSVILLVGWTPLKASTPRFQKAVVLHVEELQPYRRRVADSPPPPNKYDFDVALRVGCLIYVGLYQSAIDYLPSAIASDQSVEVSVEQHVMRVRVAGDREITLEITRHYRESPRFSSSAVNGNGWRFEIDGCEYA